MQWMETEADWLFDDPHWLELVFARLPEFLKHKPEVRGKVQQQLLVHACTLRAV